MRNRQYLCGFARF